MTTICVRYMQLYWLFVIVMFMGRTIALSFEVSEPSDVLGNVGMNEASMFLFRFFERTSAFVH